MISLLVPFGVDPLQIVQLQSSITKLNYKAQLQSSITKFNYKVQLHGSLINQLIDHNFKLNSNQLEFLRIIFRFSKM